MMRSPTVALALVLQTAEVVGWADSANASSRLGCYRHYGDQTKFSGQSTASPKRIGVSFQMKS